jgi:hypothetical protein
MLLVCHLRSDRGSTNSMSMSSISRLSSTSKSVPNEGMDPEGVVRLPKDSSVGVAVAAGESCVVGGAAASPGVRIGRGV